MKNWILLAGLALAVALIRCGGGGGGGSSTDTSTATTSTATTSTASTATTSTTSTTATTGNPLTNHILFGQPDTAAATFSVKSIDPTGGSPQTLISGVTQNIVLFVRNPAVSNQYVFFGDPNNSGMYGLYKSTGLTFNGATTLVTPAYPFVTSLSITRDGSKIVYTALGADATSLFVESIDGGAPTDYGPADAATVSQADDDTIAFTAPSVENADIDQVYTRSLTAGPGGAKNQITLENGNHLLPALSRDGAKLGYCLQTGTDNTIVIRNLATTDAVSLPNPNKVYPQALTFNPDGTKVVFAADPNGTGSGQILTQSTNGLSNPAMIYTAGVLLGNYGIYWTDENGRVIGGQMGSAIRGFRGSRVRGFR